VPVVLRLSNPIDQELTVTLTEALSPEAHRERKAAEKAAAGGAGASANTSGEGSPEEGGPAGTATAPPAVGAAAAGPDGLLGTSGKDAPKLPAQTTVVRDRASVCSTATIKLPAQALKLAAHDPLQALSADEVGPNADDDPCVVTRQGNKMTIKLDVIKGESSVVVVRLLLPAVTRTSPVAAARIRSRTHDNARSHCAAFTLAPRVCRNAHKRMHVHTRKITHARTYALTRTRTFTLSHVRSHSHTHTRRWTLT
jgi:hypothetical protein